MIRHYSLSLADRLEIELRRRSHNRLGFAIQLCLMRYPGRVLGAEETPPRAMLKYVADQIGAAPDEFALYARREETRRDHMARLMVYLDTRSATLHDRLAALLAAIQAAMGESLPLQPFALHVLSDRKESNPSMLELDAAAFSAGVSSAADWQQGLLKPLQRTATWLKQ